MLENILRRAIPQATEDERKEVHKQLTHGSGSEFDFFFMLSLATVVAAFGLITNSTATVIGAMLLSPLMSKILSVSYSMLKDDYNSLIKSFRIVLLGVLFAVISSILLGLLYPFPEPNNEILLRIKPTLFDIAIALAAGTAAAYSLIRKDLSSSLAGVAISVSLLPPLAVAGIGASLHRLDIAFGALLLFLANAIAINFASIITFWFSGIETFYLSTSMSFIRQLKISIALLLIIALPLAYIMLTTIDEARIEKIANEKLISALELKPGSSLVSTVLVHKGDVLDIHATAKSPEPITQKEVDSIRSVISKATGKKVSIVLDWIKVSVFESDLANMPTTTTTTGSREPPT